jgi:hypothetical protein
LSSLLIGSCPWLEEEKIPSKPLKIGTRLFFAIQLLPEFGFGHQTAKWGIFDHPTLETVHF